MQDFSFLLELSTVRWGRMIEEGRCTTEITSGKRLKFCIIKR